MTHTAQTWHRRSQATNGYTRGPHDEPDRGHGASRGAKIITLAITIGTLFPTLPTSLGKVLLAALPRDERERVLALPSRSGITLRWNPDETERDWALCEVRERGWALTDEQLAPGIRSIAAPVRDDASHVVAALNVNVHAAETSIATLTERYLPLLLETSDKISADWTLLRHCLQITVSTPSCANAPL